MCQLIASPGSVPVRCNVRSRSLAVGGRGKQRTLRTAARLADGWNVPYVNAEEFERLSDVLDTWCEREDKDPATLERSVNLHMRMGATAADAQRIAQERGPVGAAHGGTPADAIEMLKRYEEAGAARVSIAIRAPVEWDALEAFAEEVIPAVRR